MSENSDLERYQQLLAQLRAMSNKQMACELECSRMAAENERLKLEVMEWKSLEIERKKDVLEMTGDIPSIERLVVRYTEKKQENERR